MSPKRWVPWLLLALVPGAALLSQIPQDPGLLQDSDTKVLLETIRETRDPMGWFQGDWPLKNHFYRPVSTLVFEMDNALYGAWAPGFALTNTLLAIGCMALTFWLILELTQRPLFAGLCALLFGAWHLNWGGWLGPCFWFAAALCWLGVVRSKGRRITEVAATSLVCMFVATQLHPPISFAGRIVGWLPGRTASTMVFCLLVCLCLLARWIRLNWEHVPESPATAIDVPTTKGTARSGPTSSATAHWLAIGSFLAGLLALGSYEQAVVLPGLVATLTIWFKCQNRRIRFSPVVTSVLLLFGFLLLRRALVPSNPSGYQLQQFRSGPGVYGSLMDYALPGGNAWMPLSGAATSGPLSLLTTEFWTALLPAIGNLVALALLWRDKNRWFCLFGLASAFGSFLPMAWLKTFEHYHYLSAVFWSIWAVGLAEFAVRRLISAVSPQVIQAPRRSCHAAGSLLRP